MNLKPIDFRHSRILITNDDGIHAPGIRVLEKIAHTLSDDVWVVAPEIEQSGASHSLTVRIPLRIRKLSSRRYAVNGTPTDSVLLGMLQILKRRPPDIVLSGVNGGSNLAEDVGHSGTVAGAMEGLMLGARAIALSQIISEKGPINWKAALAYGPRVVRKLIEAPWASGVFVNVNFPNLAPEKVKGVIVTCQGRRQLQERITEAFDPFGRPYYWIGAPRQDVPSKSKEPTDTYATTMGYVSVTPMHLDHSHKGMMRTLRTAFPSK
ncbi:MAG TPA: 5'/3'-nucleotidase SurE [Alphaproteobacteria bacterium]|jgi:5'-nucleotidase|nr:5'/3'-nucleotidase SurE [Alphaproteobacteria bacterium]